MQYVHPCLTLDFTSHQACLSHQVLLVVGGLRGSGAVSTLREGARLADSIVHPFMKICSAMSARIPHLSYLSFPFVGQLPLLFITLRVSLSQHVGIFLSHARSLLGYVLFFSYWQLCNSPLYIMNGCRG